MARAPYIEPRVITLYGRGITIAPILADLGKGQQCGDVATKGTAERAVLKMISAYQEGSADPEPAGHSPG